LSRKVIYQGSAPAENASRFGMPDSITTASVADRFPIFELHHESPVWSENRRTGEHRKKSTTRFVWAIPPVRRIRRTSQLTFSISGPVVFSAARISLFWISAHLFFRPLFSFPSRGQLVSGRIQFQMRSTPPFFADASHAGNVGSAKQRAVGPQSPGGKCLIVHFQLRWERCYNPVLMPSSLRGKVEKHQR